MLEFDKLKDFAVFETVGFDKQARMFSRSTKVHKFVYIFKPIAGTPAMFRITARDSYSELLAKKTLSVAESFKFKSEMGVVSVIKPFQCEGTSFDAVLLEKSNFLFRKGDLKITIATVNVFPVFSCEFKGDESRSVIDKISHSLIALTDWRRGPHPRTYMRYLNKKTKAQTSGNEMKLEKLENVIFQLRLLPDDQVSFVEIGNLWGDYALVRFKRNTFVVYDVTQEVSETVSDNDLSAWVDKFLKHPQSAN